MTAQINIYNTEKFQLNLGDEITIWLGKVIQNHHYNYSEINYTFLTDEELLEINKTYLNHDFYTDIITFDNTIKEMISADIMISVDRVKDNAIHQNEKFEHELMRVMAHGILHCLGFKDHNEESKYEMRRKEDEVLKMFHVEQNRIKDNV